MFFRRGLVNEKYKKEDSIILSIVLGLVSIGNARNSLQHSNDILNKELQLLIEDNKLSFNMSQRIALSRRYVLFGSASYKNDFHAYSEQSEKIHKEILRLSDSEQIKDVIERSDSWRKVIEERLFPAYDEGKKDEAMRILRDEATPVARGIMNELQEMSNQHEAIITASGEEIIRKGETSVTISILASSQQTNSSMIEIANNYTELAELAEELTRKAALFKI